MSLLGSETITLKRRAAGSYVNGHFVPGAESSSSIEASVQPLTGSEILQLPEADRKKEVWKVFSESEILANDTITKSSKNYEVRSVRDFSVHSISHYEAVMVLIEGQ